MKNKNLQEKLINYFNNNPLIVLIWIVTVFFSSLITISQGASFIWNFYEANFDSKNVLYSELKHLSTNVDISYFNDNLGNPRIVDTLKDNKRSYIYINKYSYIQAITDGAGKVLSYAVTARVKDFQPVFYPPGYHDNNTNLPEIILNRTTFYDLNPTITTIRDGITSPSTDPACYPMFGANRFNYFEGEYLGHPGNYQSYFIGINDAGSWNFPNHINLIDTTLNNSDPNVCFKVPKDIRHSFINTYIETAPFEDIPWSTASAAMNNGFGVDLGEVRAISNSY